MRGNDKMVTRTLIPLLFGDMEPRRLKDLDRNLLYDFRDWKSLEAIRRSGSDDGFDMRAWERSVVATNTDEPSPDAEADGALLSEGSLWMIQCKRERSVEPARDKGIVRESLVGDGQAPYGFILVFLANFSKKAYDTFRGELRKQGVQDFYLWGKAELENMLLLPKTHTVSGRGSQESTC
jgi:hypothetical protein